MGQYYKAIVLGEENSWCLKNTGGLKLMEHSWVENDFVGQVWAILEQQPCRVCWMGDYADGVVAELTADGKPLDLGGGFITDWSQFQFYYDQAWQAGKEDKPPRRTSHNFNHKYLLNLTKEQYLDIAGYAQDHEIHPLPLLTALGNGQGGGDYYSDGGQELVGTWAFDKLFVTTELPEDFQEILPEFFDN